MNAFNPNAFGENLIPCFGFGSGGAVCNYNVETEVPIFLSCKCQKKGVISICFNRGIFLLTGEMSTSKFSYTEINRNYSLMRDRFSFSSLSPAGLVIY